MSVNSNGKPWPFSRYQIALVLLAVLPLVAVFGLLAWWRTLDLRESVTQSMLRTAEALSLAVDREIGTVRSSLETLADSETVDRRDIPGFYREAVRAAQHWQGSWIVLTDPSGLQLANTSLPQGAPLPNRFVTGPVTAGDSELPVGTARDIQNVFAGGRANNSQLFMSIGQKQPVIAVSVPAIRSGTVSYVVSVTFPPQGLIDLIHVGLHGPVRYRTLIDANGFIIASSPQSNGFATKIPAAFGVPLGEGPATGIDTVTDLGGRQAYLAYARSSVTGWTVALTVPTADAEREVAAGLIDTALAGAIGLALSVLLALWFASRLRAPMVALAAKASGKPADAQKMTFVSSELAAIDRAIEAGVRAREAEAIERERRVAAEVRKEESESANRAKDQFLAMLAHELRNPLAAISSAAAAIEQAPSATPSMMPIVKRQSQHLRKLVDDLLDVARVASGKMHLTPETIDLFELAGNCVTSFVETGRSDRHALKLEGTRVCVHADQVRMAQILTNLIDNALKFTPADGTITVTVTTDGADAVLEVRDTGVGIAADSLSHIFEVFVQGVQPLDLPKRGLGLGLALAKSLTEAQQGHIAVASEGLGKGAVFTVRMPWVPCEA